MANVKLRSKHKIRKPKPLYATAAFRLGTLSVILLVGSIYCIFFFDYFKIKNVKIEGIQKISAQEIQNQVWEILNAKAAMPQNGIFTVPGAQITKQLKERFPAAQSVSVAKSLPATIVIKITERQPLALWCPCEIPSDSLLPSYTSSTATSSLANFSDFRTFFAKQNCHTADNFDCYLVDKDGIKFENSHEFPFRIVAAKNSAALGQTAIEGNILATILKIKEKISQKISAGCDLAYIYSPAQTNFRLDGYWWAYFNPKKDIDWQINALSAVLEKKLSQQEKEKLEYIDLRFENISVVSKPENNK